MADDERLDEATRQRLIAEIGDLCPDCGKPFRHYLHPEIHHITLWNRFIIEEAWRKEQEAEMRRRERERKRSRRRRRPS